MELTDEEVYEEILIKREERRGNPLPWSCFEGMCECAPVAVEASGTLCSGCFTD